MAPTTRIWTHSHVRSLTTHARPKISAGQPIYGISEEIERSAVMQTIKIHLHPGWSRVCRAATMKLILVALVVVLTGCGRTDTGGNGSVASTATHPGASAIEASATVPALVDTDYTPAEKAQVEAL